MLSLYHVSMRFLSFIDLEQGGFGEILPEVMIFPDGEMIYYTEKNYISYAKT